MTSATPAHPAGSGSVSSWRHMMVTQLSPIVVLMLLMFAWAGDRPPMVNEAHYLVKAKNFWQPEWCQDDLFASSARAHTTYNVTLGWLTAVFSLETAAWVARIVGWLGLAIGLQHLCNGLIRHRYASASVLVLWLVGIRYGNLAGEWVVGGTEAKVPAYALVLLGLASMVRGRWNATWIYFGAASAFHVLVGGWSVLAALLAWVMTRGRDEAGSPHRLLTWGLWLGGGLSLFGLVPALLLTARATTEESIAAATTYVYVRISHHLLPTVFPAQWYVRHAITIVLAMVAVILVHRGLSKMRGDKAGWKRLSWFVVGTLVIAVIGLIIGVSSIFGHDLTARLLKYYWFRMTDVAVPLLLALATTWCLVSDSTTRWGRFAATTLICIASASFVWTTVDEARLGVPPSVSNRLLGYDSEASPAKQQAVFADWLKVCDFIRHGTPEDEIFLTPRHQQTFKWYAHRAEVVNFKDVPQDAGALLEWSDRFNDVFPPRLSRMRVTIRYDVLRQYRRKYGVRYMLVDRRIAGPSLPLIRLYPRPPETNTTYAIYELPPPVARSD